MINFYWLIFFLIWIMGFLIFFSYNYVRLFSYSFFIFYFLFFIFLLLIINKSIFWYFVIFKFYISQALQFSYIIGLDSLSIYFILLCVFILMYCLLIYWNLKYKINLYIFLLFLSLFLFLNIFSSLDLFFFYVYFEAVVVPMFLLIGIWGSRTRKVYASYLFFLYTLFSSVFILFCLISIHLNTGSSLFDYFLNSYFFTDRQVFIWILLFLGFAIKIPMLPLHIWLPEAHVEAPTPGSVILAGILLKLGSYAMLRLLLNFFYDVSYDLIFAVLTLSLIGFTYASMAALSQIDIKKIIAYSSVAHMNFSLLGMFSFNILGLAGMFFLMFGHAITSGALFLGVGVLYDRYKTRLIFYYGSLVIFMPLFSILYLIFILSNFGFPGTSNFVGEFLILVGAFDFSNVMVFLASLGMILSLIYSLFLYNRIFFGSLQKTFIRFYCDCSRLEFITLFIFVIFVFILGLYPGLSMFNFISSSLIFEVVNY